MRKILILALVSGLPACEGDGGRTSDVTRLDAREVVEAAARRLGILDAPAAAVGFEADGTLDKGPEGQGLRQGRPSPGPFSERLAIDPAGGAVARHYHEQRFDGSFEIVGEVYGPDDRTLTLLPTYGITVRSASPAATESAQRIARRLPHVLVGELLEDPARIVGARSDADGVTVEASLRGGQAVTVTFDRVDSTVSGVEVLDELEGLGPTLIRWSFGDYRTGDSGVALPWRYDVDLDGAPYLRMRVTSLLDDARLAAALQSPDSLRVIDVESSDPGSDEEVPLELVEIADGVYRVPEVRGGFAPLVVALDGFSVVVDAPASFPLLAELPPGHTDPAPSMSHHSERLIDAVSAALPDHPIRYLVLTHGHLDHLGGVRAFVHAGATVLGAPSVRESVDRLVARDDVRPDRLAGSPRSLSWEDVQRAREISDGQRTVRLLPLGQNPHDEGMMVVHVVDADLLFVSDLFTPTRFQDYPRAHHAALDRFLDRWLLDQGLEVDRILTMHGAGEITPAHRAKLR